MTVPTTIDAGADGPHTSPLDSTFFDEFPRLVDYYLPGFLSAFRPLDDESTAKAKRIVGTTQGRS